MTRVNAGIPVQRLPSKLLLSEHREIKRIPNHLAKHGFNSSRFKEVPAGFKLGKGHVLFFLCRGAYTHLRYIELYNECVSRGYNVQNYEDAWNIYQDYPILYNKYSPTAKDVAILKARFKERNYKLIN